MKRLLPLILIVAFTIKASAQVTFTLTTAPCRNNGVLLAAFNPALTPPLNVTWTTYGSTGTNIVHTGVSGLADILTGYSGGVVLVVAVDVFGVSDGGFYMGMPPFNVALTNASAICPAPDTAFAVVTGGTAPYTYQWSNEVTSAVVGTGRSITAAAGYYGVTVTDAAGCVYGSMVDYLVDTLTSIPTFVVNATTTTASCTDGTATATTAGGGVPPFTYLWTNGSTRPALTGLVTGTYGVTVTDAAGCTNTLAGVFVPQSASISGTVTPSPASCSTTDGAVTVTVSGGTAPYSYAWSNGASTATQTGLPSGIYTVNITDANGCTGSGGAFVSSSSPISISYNTSPSLCLTATGTATLMISGGTGPYNVTWYTHPAQTGTTATNLAAGTYYFRATDALGCELTSSVTVPSIENISATFSATNALCSLSNGSLTVFPTGGVTPYSYSWNTGATISNITAVPAGTYSVTVRDNLGCKASFTENVPVSSPVGVGLMASPASCVLSNDGSISAVAYGGTAPYAYGWSGGGSGSTLGGLPAGYYVVHVTDATGCSASASTVLGYDPTSSACYSTITGTVYNDINGNCIQDAGEPGIPNMQIGCSGGIGYTYTDMNGNYSIKVPTGVYTVSETVTANYALPLCQANNIAVSAVAGAGSLHTINFANTVTPVHDLHISTWDYNRAVPGNDYFQKVIVTNNGTVTENAFFTGYKADGQTFSPVFTPSGIFAGGSADWYSTSGGSTVDTLVPGASQNFTLIYPIPANISTGTNVLYKDTVAYTAPMANWLADNTPWDNVNSFNSIVRNSFDANFKQVYPQGTGPAGIISYTDSVLEYMVRFQNTGAMPVQNVVIIDTLDDNLNWTTLMPGYRSAACNITVAQSGTARKVAKFTFTNINLPAAQSNDLSSTGMLTYTIHTRPGLPIGTQFRNSASVYLDYNTPATTNTTINTLGSVPSSVITTTNAEYYQFFSVYPNPASNAFSSVINTEIATNANISISDVTGKLLTSKAVALHKGVQTITTDITQLNPGVYFVTLNANGKTQTEKLVIIK